MINKEEFYTEISEILELDDELILNENTSIEEILEIDSLAHITIISYVMDKYHIELKADEFSNVDKLEQLITFINGKKK